MAAGKWLRLDRHCLSKPEFREIADRPDGMAYALIYMSLLVAFGEYVPCDKDVLASRLHFEASKVQEALNAFYRKKLVTVMDSRPNRRYERPSLEDVKAYCIERKSDVNPRRFFDYYEAVGWKKGQTPIEDWRAALRCWEKEKYDGDSSAKYEPVTEEYLKYLESLTNHI